ncbi:hypothetical protein C0992_008921 [Termitomyces sp. T32_za158]|nr:hypothetical protein C0992_008921 [Termitomyces sp. T32_za158]
MQNTNTNQKQRGLRMLSLGMLLWLQITSTKFAVDDGGVRGLSELIILKEIMHRLMYLEKAQSLPKPCDYFDIIGGAGTGGLIALMLGRLHMPINLAIDNYVLFCQKVFSDVKKWSIGTEKFKATVFESAMRDILQSTGFPEDVLMQENDPLCKSFVVAFPSKNITPRIFRTYQVGANQGSNCTVVQAARATTATPDLFKPVFIISGGLSESFVGGRLGYSNSTNLVLNEAIKAFGFSQPVACFVNIGAGHPGPVSWEPTKVFSKKMMEFFYQISTDCEAEAEKFVENYINIPGLFYRLSVDQGLQKMPLDDWDKLGDIQTHSKAYLEKAKVTNEVNRLVGILSGYNNLQKATLQDLR